MKPGHHVKLTIVMLLVVFAISEGTCAAALEEGRAWYARRAEGAQDLIVRETPINNAIAAFTKAMSEPQSELAATVGLLKSLYFKGTFVETEANKQKAVFEQGKKLSEQMLKKYPTDAALNYWSAVVWGRWGEVYGIFQAAREGAADRIKRCLEQTLASDEFYDKGAAYMVLGRLHHKAPKIPLLLGWPSKALAEINIRKSIELDDAVPTRRLYLAELLADKDKYDDARLVLSQIANMTERADNSIEDRTDKAKARALFTKIAGK